MSVVAHKRYVADRRPFHEQFRTRHIVFIAATSAGKVFCSYCSATLTQSKKKKKKMRTKNYRLAFITSFTKSLGIRACRRILREIAIAHLRPEVVHKLLKSVSRSATRKFMRTHSRSAASVLIFKTSIRANVLGQVSIFLVEEAHQVIRFLLRRYKASRKARERKQLLNGADAEDKRKQEISTKLFLYLTIKNVHRSSLAVVTSGIGAAVGTFIRPGLGTFIGTMVGESITFGF